jgi:hypothetical protein
MKNTKSFLLIISLLFIELTSLYSQAEFPRVVMDYQRINDNAKQIRESKIRKCVEVKLVNNVADTMKILYFDNNGNLLQQFIADESTKDADDYKKSYFNYFYLYDITGKLIQKIDSSGGNVLKFTLSYDDVGNISGEEVKSHNEVIREVTFEYDQLSRLIESKEKDIIQGCKTTETYSYDSYNNLAKLIYKTSCSQSTKAPSTTYIYKYDQKSNIIEKQTSLSAGGFKTEMFKYGDKGRLTETYITTGKDSYIKYVYTNDIANNTIKIEKTVGDGEVTATSMQVLRYDKFWNLIEEQSIAPNGKELYTKKNIYEFYN